MNYRRNVSGLLLIVGLIFSTTAIAQKSKTVGGAEMYPDKNIVENAVNSKDHTTLVAAVQAADLVEVLKSEGPFTVFAPTNTAFEALPSGTVEGLLKPDEISKLQSVLKYHVIPGDLSQKDLKKMIKKASGEAKIATVQGDQLTLTREKGDIVITDFNGNKSSITIGDVAQSNGVIHVVDGVMIPEFRF
tara:strand:+ start:369 stop:935 length:567 start_codon:yes stop_codon:yes gene_type:complete